MGHSGTSFGPGCYGNLSLMVAISLKKQVVYCHGTLKAKGGPRIFYMTLSTVGGNREGRPSFKLNFLHLGK